MDYALLTCHETRAHEHTISPHCQGGNKSPCVGEASSGNNRHVHGVAGYRDSDHSAYLFLPGRGLSGRYDKVRLVPFGEYVPFVQLLPEEARHGIRDWVRERFLVFPYMKPGAGPEPILIEGERATFRAGVLICYEDVIPALTAEMVRRGADLLVNPSNEAWYRHREMDQHVMIARMRVETPPDFDSVSTSEIVRCIRAPMEAPLRVDFAGGWLDVPRLARPNAYLVNCAISPLVSLRHWPYHAKSGLGGSGAYALLQGDSGVASELNLGVGWQDPAVIHETGLCVWRSGAKPALDCIALNGSTYLESRR